MPVLPLSVSTTNKKILSTNLFDLHFEMFRWNRDSRGREFAPGRAASNLGPHLLLVFQRLAVKMLGISGHCIDRVHRTLHEADCGRLLHLVTFIDLRRRLSATSRCERLPRERERERETCLARVRHAALILVIHIPD